MDFIGPITCRRNWQVNDPEECLMSVVGKPGRCFASVTGGLMSGRGCLYQKNPHFDGMNVALCGRKNRPSLPAAGCCEGYDAGAINARAGAAKPEIVNGVE